MKAVILAGGKGSRLRPLTCNKPKPMVPLLGQPCMAYTIDLLQRSGAGDIAVTLQYMPDVIRGYFGDGSEHGVQIAYFEETTPLGTAGSVKNAQEFLDETFIVISGDALTDFNLLAAVRAHREKGALATIILTRVETPLEFGVAITEADGRITRFLEKPSWGEVFSDTVNTGIYIFEKEVLEFIPEDQEFDFSKDLFPKLMQNGHDLYGYVAEGYWSDIGNLAQYRQTQFDMLEGKVNCAIQGFRVAPKIWMGQGAQVAEGVTLEPPCYIGRDTVIEAGAHIGPYTVLGVGNVIKAGASLKRTVVWNRSYLGDGVELRGATLCSQLNLQSHVACFEGSVIGDACSLGAKSVVKPQVKLWPGKRVQEGTVAHSSLIWGEKLEKSLFGLYGVQGIGNVDMTPDFAGRLAAAFGAALPFGASVAVACDHDPFSSLIKRALAAGLHSAGVNTIDCGAATTPMLRYAVRCVEAEAGIQVRRLGPAGDDRVLIECLDQSGINIDKALERKIENAYWQEDFRRANLAQIGRNRVFTGLQESYAAELLQQVSVDAVKRERFRVAMQYDPMLWGRFVPELMERLGCKVSVLDAREASQGELQNLVSTGIFHLGVRFDDNGEEIALITDRSQMIERDRLLALQTLIQLISGSDKVAVPVTAPSIIETLAAKFGALAVRTKANPRSLMEPLRHQPFPMLYDAMYMLVKVLDTLALSRLALSELVESIPHFHLLRRDVPCPWEDKGRVMRLLIEELRDETVELVDGIKVFKDGGWTLILPDSDEPMFQVFAQGVTEQLAEELAGMYAQKIRDYQKTSVRG
ncbi:mannose-1-phosphate guanylyltransferase/phosphomannomutase [Tumebacillus sp. BK434]|uniref:sugar phosphate nucleotidyltransferase n=1 Tax=Tumebacillus sp. BK434 TaxID=2512169 RepID=UPI001046F15E|nr:sugar phosphate nucleotidyltransferase [Tumebacillus sp. BK434]TCP53726.1 mannose-1-phosphate guanylyltransferase/phosphomannomutase [Tumebacillus sp. BK434]